MRTSVLRSNSFALLQNYLVYRDLQQNSFTNINFVKCPYYTGPIETTGGQHFVTALINHSLLLHITFFHPPVY